MSNPQAKQPHCVQSCYKLIKELGWRWDNPRIISWLSRVGIAQTGAPYSITSSTIPEAVWISLAKFLDLRLKCERTLILLRWNWNHGKVKEIASNYSCTGQLPLKGYQELYQLLDEEWFMNGGFLYREKLYSQNYIYKTMSTIGYAFRIIHQGYSNSILEGRDSFVCYLTNNNKGFSQDAIAAIKKRLEPMTFNIPVHI